MNNLAAVIICAIWGMTATILFFKAWLAFLGVLAGMIGLARGRNPRMTVLAHLYNSFTNCAFCSAILVFIFVLLFRVGGMGRAPLEVAAFWIAATVGLAVTLPAIPAKIDELWTKTNGED